MWQRRCGRVPAGGASGGEAHAVPQADGASDPAGKSDGVIDWEGKTRAELGGAIAAVELRLAWKNVLARGVAAYTDAGSA